MGSCIIKFRTLETMSLFVSAWRGEEVVKQKLNRGRERGCNGRNVLTYFMGDLCAVSNVHNINAIYSSGSMAFCWFYPQESWNWETGNFSNVKLVLSPKKLENKDFRPASIPSTSQKMLINMHRVMSRKEERLVK